MQTHQRVLQRNISPRILPLTLTLTLVLLAASALLTACGGEDTDADDSADADSSATSAPAAGLTVDLDGVHIVAAWARPALASDADSGTPAMDMGMHDAAGTTTSAVYLTLENRTGTALRIVSATSDVAAAVELHATTMNGGMMQMAPVEQMDVPANGSLTLAPGGLHIMLIGLTRDLAVGDTIDLTLTTDAGDTLVLEGIPVREPGT